MKRFGEIRLLTIKDWYVGLNRVRVDGELTDDYSKSPWCKIQNECTVNGMHCSFICSLGDWLDNISDLLHDNRFDELSSEDYEVLFRYYTRILLIVSEVIEDFVMLNKKILGFVKKNDASRDLEYGILNTNELKRFSQFTNTVCKHKTENNNLHVHNHHLKIEFSDFDSIAHANQIRLDKQDWSSINHHTTILIPNLSYFIGLVIKTSSKIIDYIDNKPDYKMGLIALYADEWTIESQNELADQNE